MCFSLYLEARTLGRMGTSKPPFASEESSHSKKYRAYVHNEALWSQRSWKTAFKERVWADRSAQRNQVSGEAILMNQKIPKLYCALIRSLHAFVVSRASLSFCHRSNKAPPNCLEYLFLKYCQLLPLELSINLCSPPHSRFCNLAFVPQELLLVLSFDEVFLYLHILVWSELQEQERPNATSRHISRKPSKTCWISRQQDAFIILVLPSKQFRTCEEDDAMRQHYSYSRVKVLWSKFLDIFRKGSWKNILICQGKATSKCCRIRWEIFHMSPRARFRALQNHSSKSWSLATTC